MIYPQSIQEMRTVEQMLSMKDKVFLVTGAAGGIGRATAVAFAQMGAKVALMDIPPMAEKLQELSATLQELYGCECMYVTGDISDPASVDAFLGEIVARWGHIDIVHNNAGIGVWPDHADMSVESWEKICKINLSGSYYVARACGKLMKDQGRAGSIVTTASVSATIVNTGPGYAATKAGVKHMSASLAMEYAETGIRFNTVSYGYIVSGMHKAAGDDAAVEALYADMIRKTPMGRIGALDEVVGAVIYLGSDLSSFQTGTDMLVDGGISIGRLK